MHHSWMSRQGFTLVEVLIVSMTVATLMGLSMMVLPGVLEATKADSGTRQLTGVLRAVREQAITERRNIEIRFIPPNRIEAWRDDVDDNDNPAGQTRVQENTLEQGVEYSRFPGVADTPDGFAVGALPVEFTGVAPWRFTSEGQVVDANGDVVNGSVFLGRPLEPETARAVTLFGPTALLREWRWNGAGWVE